MNICSLSGVDRLLSVKEVAAMLGVCVRAVWQMLSAGLLMRVKPLGKRRTCVSFLEVQAYILRLREGHHARV